MSTPDFISESFTVVVNGQPQTTTARTLQDWVDAQSVQPAALATAVNGEFVPRDLRAQRLLCVGDLIVTFQPIQGG
ncbi:MAG TPA: sulfur carrier protein ThiS [Rhodoferax sp.]|jgi:sulfur carrier protein|nr:sulfur carrier protein ThiS [Rhodoferax sp.]HQY77451.1 sulfur carrier protein ThiS [Rhodoferax sp.]